MGTPVIHKKNLSAALNNCAFVSTEDIAEDPTRPFEFLMDASMLGVGVGFDTKGKDKVTIVGPKADESMTYLIEDSREGWVNSVSVLLKSFLGVKGEKQPAVEFDYSAIRPEGMPLKTFGGVSSGPRPLRELHEMINSLLSKRVGSVLDSTTIVDLFNLIGKCVVSGNVRRSAEIAFGEADDEAFLDLKDYEKNPERMAWGWSSNNSVFARVGMDYTNIANHLRVNGEPGLAWLENMQKYGRMCEPPNFKDVKVKGGNPCLEQSLESYELCCLVETFPARHASLEEYKRTLKFAYLYAKTVTLRMTHWPETNRVMLRNRRIGCSVSGVADFLGQHNLDELRVWLDEGYQTVQHWDEVYSNWFCIPRSIKTTSVKPSGTVSLLAGATPGMHFPESRIYIRRMRMSKNDPLCKPLREAGYSVVPAIGQEDTTVVVEMPIRLPESVRVQSEVSMFPKQDYSKYPQLPYEAISEEVYEAMTKGLKPIVFMDRSSALKKEVRESPVKVTQKNRFGVKVDKKDSARRQLFSEEEEKEEGVGQVFPDAVSFCTNDHCQL